MVAGMGGVQHGVEIFVGIDATPASILNRISNKVMRKVSFPRG